MTIGDYFTIDGKTVKRDPLTFNTDDIEFAALQAVAVLGMEILELGVNFATLGDGNKRLVIGRE